MISQIQTKTDILMLVGNYIYGRISEINSRLYDKNGQDYFLSRNVNGGSVFSDFVTFDSVSGASCLLSVPNELLNYAFTSANVTSEGLIKPLRLSNTLPSYLPVVPVVGKAYTGNISMSPTNTPNTRKEFSIPVSAEVPYNVVMISVDDIAKDQRLAIINPNLWRGYGLVTIMCVSYGYVDFLHTEALCLGGIIARIISEMNEDGRYPFAASIPEKFNTTDGVARINEMNERHKELQSNFRFDGVKIMDIGGYTSVEEETERYEVQVECSFQYEFGYDR